MDAQQGAVLEQGDEMDAISDAAKLYEDYVELAIVTNLADLTRAPAPVQAFEPPAIGLVILGS